MLRSSERETEILLGNKQLLAIFFVLAVLLGAAFYGGYAMGKSAGARAAAAAATPAQPAEAPATSLNVPSSGGPSAPTSGGETHSVPADSGTATDANAASGSNIAASEPEPLGSPKRKAATRTEPEPSADATIDVSGGESFAPHTGQTFLQVTAVGRDEAIAIADVLHKKGFRAHAVPKPGGGKLYRVIVGPVRDAGDLASTRDSLRRTGFREVIVQRY